MAEERRAVRGLWQSVKVLVKREIDWLVGRLRRSLQFRTVLITTLVAFVAIGGVGIFLSNQIAAGLFRERLLQATAETARGVATVQAGFNGTPASDASVLSQQARYTLNELVLGDSGNNRKYILIPIPGQKNSLPISSLDSGGLTASIIPDDLRAAVQQADGLFWKSIPLPVGSSGTRPGVAIGAQVTLADNDYELYLVYDLNSSQETLNYIQSVLWIAGALLLVLIAGIAWFVTRNVVQPVSQAALVAEKLAAGELNERMDVKGEDEVARLSDSFNKMANALQEQITQLATLSHMQRNFVSDVSHELRTPLTTVRMAAEVLYEARESFDPVNRRSAELMYHQVERFQALLADLLEISRFDAGAAVLDSEPQEIFTVIDKVLEASAPLADRIGSTIRLVSAVPGNSCIVEMDPRRIERILRNLVVNALEHGEQKPIEVYIAADADVVALAVRDHGIGMDEVALSRVFDRFWRADPARARTTGGSGLGLAIATEDSRLHNGKLEVWSEPGAGACFRLTLPRKRGQNVTHSPLGLPPGGSDLLLDRLTDAPVADLVQTGPVEHPGKLKEADE
ncbi:MAG: HAMP domain-containing histidine kinase [Renibacterium sp.]|nr:HAMP domain-containing histidine kinase [Renibacterium sp.]